MSMPVRRIVSIAIAACAASWGIADAADVPGAKPGDETLTCEQIYAEGMAESQRDQQERKQKMQGPGPAAMLAGAIATNGQSVIDRNKAMAEIAMAPPNPRLERLKQLWTQKHCARN